MKRLVRTAAAAALLLPGIAFANPLPVPEEKQDNLTTSCGSCGSTAVGMALSYLGEEDTPDAVEHYLYDLLPCGPGDDLLAGAADDYCSAKLGVSDCAKDFNWSSYDPWELGLAQIDAGRPFVAHTNVYGGHYVLVVGMTTEAGAQYVYYNDPAKGSRLKATWSDFKAIWSPKSYKGVRFLFDRPGEDAGVAPDSGSAPDSGGQCVSTALQAKGFWSLGSTIRDEGPSSVIATLKAHHATDLFVMIKGADGSYRFDTLDAVIVARDAAKSGLRVHAWVTCFHDEAKGGWVDPSGASYRKYLLDEIIGPALSEHAIDGLSLDYVRYPGTAGGSTAPITSFVQEVRAAVESRRPGAILSAAVMPEGAGNAQAYGQDYGELAGPLDVLLPMTYTYNYEAGSDWVKTSTAYVSGKAGSNAEVWSTLQSLNDQGAMMPGERLQGELSAALSGGASGIALFRYPVSAAQWAVLDDNPIVKCEPAPADGGLEDAAADGAPAEASPPGADAAGYADAAPDSAGPGGDDPGGCSCRAARSSNGQPGLASASFLAAIAWRVTRRRRRR